MGLLKYITTVSHRLAKNAYWKSSRGLLHFEAIEEDQLYLGN